MKDDWRTLDYLFNQLNYEFNFEIDLCATEENKKLPRYCENVFTFNEKNLSSFMNPPYSRPKNFIIKTYELAFQNNCLVVLIVKCDTSTSWWGTFWDYINHKPRNNIEIRYFPKRIQFINAETLSKLFAEEELEIVFDNKIQRDIFIKFLQRLIALLIKNNQTILDYIEKYR